MVQLGAVGCKLQITVVTSIGVLLNMMKFHMAHTVCLVHGSQPTENTGPLSVLVLLHMLIHSLSMSLLGLFDVGICNIVLLFFKRQQFGHSMLFLVMPVNVCPYRIVRYERFATVIAGVCVFLEVSCLNVTGCILFVTKCFSTYLATPLFDF
jgi:hypothetical protein